MPVLFVFSLSVAFDLALRHIPPLVSLTSMQVHVQLDLREEHHHTQLTPDFAPYCIYYLEIRVRGSSRFLEILQQDRDR